MFSADPTATGLDVELSDEADELVLSGVIPGGEFEEQGGVKFSFRDTDGMVSSANGIVSVSIKKNLTTGMARISIKTAGVDLPGAAGQATMSLSLLFGTDPATDDCLSARHVSCDASSTRTRCKQL